MQEALRLLNSTPVLEKKQIAKKRISQEMGSMFINHILNMPPKQFTPDDIKNITKHVEHKWKRKRNRRQQFNNSEEKVADNNIEEVFSPQCPYAQETHVDTNQNKYAPNVNSTNIVKPAGDTMSVKKNQCHA